MLLDRAQAYPTYWNRKWAETTSEVWQCWRIANTLARLMNSLLPLANYSVSGIGFSDGGSIPNVPAVMQVIEKLPINAISPTRLSSPMVFSAAA